MNRNKHIKSRRLLFIGAIVFGLAALLSFLAISIGATSSVPDKELNPPESVKTDSAPATVAHVYGLPVRLTIPKINIDTNIQQMGLTSSGVMEAPDSNKDAGWYKYGPRPGNDGSAVIDGHFGLGNTKAVFSDLGMLEKGDKVTVTDDRGDISTFVVRTTKYYDKDAQPAEVFNSIMGSYLNLITCGGDWEEDQSTYTQRLVVFTDRL